MPSEKKGRRSKVSSQTALPRREKSRDQPSKAEDVILEDSSLRALTQKIQTNLQHSESTRSGPGQKSRPKSHSSELEPTRTRRSSGDKSKRPKTPQEDTVGDGKIAPKLVKHYAKVHHAGKKEKPNQRPSAGAQLLPEVLALGGTEEDLELIQSASSGSEMDMEATQGDKDELSNQSLRHGMVGLIQNIKTQTEGLSATASIGPTPSRGTQSERKTQKRKAGSERHDYQIPKPSEPHKSSSAKDTKKGGRSSQLVFKPRADWHTAIMSSTTALNTERQLPPQALMKRLHEHACTLLKTDNDIYTASHLSSSSSHRFLSTIMSSGTLSDKISALTLLVQESPLHNMKALETLLGLAKKRSRGQAITALSAVKDLMAQGELLPSTRKLKTFVTQPLLLEAASHPQALNWKPGDALPSQLKEEDLVYFAYEDWLKTAYYQMIQYLETWCNDDIQFAKASALSMVYELLKEKPEQEANLLRLLINKLGDPDKKIASKASYLLLQLQTSHPLMRPIIISSVESELLLRPGQTSHAKYYAIITLNQTILSHREEHVAAKLLEVYFALFVILLKDTEDGHPVSHGKPSRAEGDDKATKGKPRAKGSYKKGIKSSGVKTEEEVRDKMISAILTGVNRALPFAGRDEERLQKHVDTLFRITHSANFNTSIQALLLLQQLSTTNQGASDRFYRTLYESLLDPRLLTSSKQAMYLNLLFKSIRADLSMKRVKAFVKRLLQICFLHQPAFACGVLYLIKELEDSFAGLHGLVDQPEEGPEDEEEHFQDISDDNGTQKEVENGTKIGDGPDRENGHQRAVYDGRKRDPEHCNADKSCLWELLPLTAHFHPSVALFAFRLLRHEDKPPKPDLSLHTLIHFLDRFVYRNAKTVPAPRGVSIMQPLAGDIDQGIFLLSRDSSKTKTPLNVAAFAAKKPEDVSVDEVFFHNYFSQAGRGKLASEAKALRERKDHDDVDDEPDEHEDEVWKALVGSKPELEGSEEGDDELDLDLDDLTDSDEEDATGVKAQASDIDETMEASSDVERDSPDGPLFSSEGDNLSEFDDSSVNATDEKDDGDAKNTSRRESARQKRRKLKHLPTFASVEDYAEMLANDDEE